MSSERLTDGLTIELIHQLKDLADDRPWLSEVGQRAVQNMVAAEIDLENLRSQHAEVLGTVRELHELISDYQDIPAARFTEKYSVPLDDPMFITTSIWLHNQMRAALVALAEVPS